MRFALATGPMTSAKGIVRKPSRGASVFGKIDAGRYENGMAEQRIEPMCDGMGNPRKEPHREDRVGPRPEETVRTSGKDRPEGHDAKNEVHRHDCDAKPRTSSRRSVATVGRRPGDVGQLGDGHWAFLVKSAPAGDQPRNARASVED